MESCDIYGVQNVPKQTKPCDHGKENAFQVPLFIHFDDPGLPIGNRYETPGNITISYMSAKNN